MPVCFYTLAVDAKDASLERIAAPLERVAAALEIQQPSRLEQALAIGVAIAAIMGTVSAIDIIRQWIGR